ncbi:hypothetical protein CN544_24190 [Bacillus toyonensis]|nr:hypothetical protein CN539_28490 [Bacillus toyonensis]PEN78873.1 hypothetical protein CN544_24190 [Bacillus toyonensis]QWH48382.1 hypothetical protein EXW64_28125 [Bacillus toyonensis]
MFSTRSKQKDNHHIIIIIYFLLILNIRTIINKYIYIEKFITKLVINDSKLQSKLLAICLLSNSLEVHIFLFQKTRVYKGGFD